jgi:hypothetical protein
VSCPCLLCVSGENVLIERQSISPDRKDGRRDPDEALVSESLLASGITQNRPMLITCADHD